MFYEVLLMPQFSNTLAPLLISDNPSARVYRALLHSGELDAASLVKATRCSKRSVAYALEFLYVEGIVEKKWDVKDGRVVLYRVKL